MEGEYAYDGECQANVAKEIPDWNPARGNRRTMNQLEITWNSKAWQSARNLSQDCGHGQRTSHDPVRGVMLRKGGRDTLVRCSDQIRWRRHSMQDKSMDGATDTPHRECDKGRGLKTKTPTGMGWRFVGNIPGGGTRNRTRVRFLKKSPSARTESVF